MWLNILYVFTNMYSGRYIPEMNYQDLLCFKPLCNILQRKKTSVFSNSIQFLFSHFLMSHSVWCVHGQSVSTSLSLHLIVLRQDLLFNLEPSGWLHWPQSKLPGPATAGFLCDYWRSESGPHALKGTLYLPGISQPGL